MSNIHHLAIWRNKPLLDVLSKHKTLSNNRIPSRRLGVYRYKMVINSKYVGSSSFMNQCAVGQYNTRFQLVINHPVKLKIKLQNYITRENHSEVKNPGKNSSAYSYFYRYHIKYIFIDKKYIILCFLFVRLVYTAIETGG